MQDTRSRDEFERAVYELSSANWARLKSAARYYSNPYLSPDDLLQETFRRALDGTRKWPIDVDVVRFLVEAIRSVADGELNKVSNQRAPVLAGSDEFCDEEEESRRVAAENASHIQSEIMLLFEDDQKAADIIVGLMEGMDPDDIREITELDKRSYDSKRRLIRRRIDKKYPEGWGR